MLQYEYETKKTKGGHALDCHINLFNDDRYPCTCSGASGKKAEAVVTDEIEGVQKPNHYAFFDGIEAIEIIARSMTKAEFRGYCLGNMLKYRLRAGKKSELAYAEKDLAKANFYAELFDKHKDKCYDA